MKRQLLVGFLGFCLLILIGGCDNPRTKSSMVITKEPFDIVAATEILEKTEKCVIDLVAQGGGKEESKELFITAYGEHGYNVWSTFFDGRDIAAGGEELHLVPQGIFYPTIYHQGIEITEAYLEKRESPKHEDSFLTGEYLCIEERYTGTDVKLQDFYRINWFKKDKQGNWQFETFEGHVNIGDDSFSFAYLQLK